MSEKKENLGTSIVRFSEDLCYVEEINPVRCCWCFLKENTVFQVKAVPLQLRGVTAGLIQAVCSIIDQKRSFGAWALKHTTRDLLSWVQKTAVISRVSGETTDGTSLCELVRTTISEGLETNWYGTNYPLNSYRPKKFMSYSWDYPVMFMWRLWEYGHVENDDALWIDVFAVNQLNKEKQSHDLQELKATIGQIGHTILVLDETAFALTRHRFFLSIFGPSQFFDFISYC